MSYDRCTCKPLLRRSSGRLYMGEMACLRCGGLYDTGLRPKPVEASEPSPPPPLPSLQITSLVLDDVASFRSAAFEAAGLDRPSQYKGMGGSKTLPTDELLELLIVGRVPGPDREPLAQRLESLELSLDQEHQKRRLIYVLRSGDVSWWLQGTTNGGVFL